jgi:hypothetical protein
MSSGTRPTRTASRGATSPQRAVVSGIFILAAAIARAILRRAMHRRYAAGHVSHELSRVSARVHRNKQAPGRAPLPFGCVEAVVIPLGVSC